MFDSKEHWVICESCSLKTRAELHWLDSDGNCKACGYKKEMTCEHSMVSGTCTECGYHEHQYECDEEKHTAICGCLNTTGTEQHVFDDDDKCTICGYQFVIEDPETDASDTSVVGGADDGKVNVNITGTVGCDASVGATAIIGCVAALGCALAFRKKDN